MAQTSAVLGASPEPITAGQRARFDRDGYLIIRGALGPDEVMAARDALDRVYAAAATAGSLGPNGSMHQLSAVANCAEVVGLIDHPAAFRYVWSVLGWNIHIYHSHLEVHPPVREPQPFRLNGTRTAAGRTARSRQPRGRGYR
jgi:ectoine hydroxylase